MPFLKRTSFVANWKLTNFGLVLTMFLGVGLPTPSAAERQNSLTPEASNKCAAGNFGEAEKYAKQEVKDYTIEKPYYARLVFFTALLHNAKQNAGVYCHYTTDDYLALLWLSTNILIKIRQETGPFERETTTSWAESTLNRLWVEGFEKGWNSLPRNPDQLRCLNSGVLLYIKKCEKLDPGFFRSVRKKRLPKGWPTLRFRL